MVSNIHKELGTVNGLLCLLITVGCLPLLVWHSWGALSGPARLSLVGFAIADLALWSAARWASRAETGLVRAVALASKAILAALLLLTAASVIALHSSQQRRDVAADRAAAAEVARLDRVAQLARDLSSTSGRSVAREFLEASRPAGSSLPSVPADSVDGWREYLPAWWDPLGIIALPPLTGLICLLVLTAVISTAAPIPIAQSETTGTDLPERRMGFSAPMPMPNYVNFRRSDRAPIPTPTHPASGYTDGQTIKLERKKNGRLEAWLVDPTTTRGKRYLTSFSGDLSEADRQLRIETALRKAAA